MINGQISSSSSVREFIKIHGNLWLSEGTVSFFSVNFGRFEVKALFRWQFSNVR